MIALAASPLIGVVDYETITLFFLHSASGVHTFELVKILDTYLLGVVSLMLFGLAFIKFLLRVERADTDNWGTSKLYP